MATRKKKEAKDGHVITLSGKEYITHIGLLDLAHKAGIQRLGGEFLYELCDPDQDRYVYQATVISADGLEFSAVGHASPKNLNRKMVAFAAVMAETRAWNRAMRSMVNHGATTADEMQSVGLGSQIIEQSPERPVRDMQRSPDGTYSPMWAFGSEHFKRIAGMVSMDIHDVQMDKPTFQEIEHMCEIWSKGRVHPDQLSPSRLYALLDKVESAEGIELLAEIRERDGIYVADGHENEPTPPIPSVGGAA